MKKFVCKILPSLIFAVMLAPSTQAAPICASAALSNYLTAGFECEIDQALFSDFSFQTQGGGTVAHLNSNEIDVSPLSGVNEVGLRFSGDFEAEGGPNGPGPAAGLRVAAYRFIYQVTRPNSEFVSATAAIDPGYTFNFVNPLKFGGLLLGKSIANDGASASALVNLGTTQPTNSTLLNTPRQNIHVDDLWQLSGGASAAGTNAPVGYVAANYVDNLFTFESVAVPEPTSLAMLLASAFVLFGMRRPVRRRAS